MADPIRFQDIYAEHAPAVYRCLLVWTRNSAVAEDLTAETFVRALASEQPVRAASARAYLIAIARNLWRQQLRSGWRQQPLDQAPAAAREDPDAVLALQAVLAALAELPDPLREPLVLFAQGGLSYEAIAEQLQLPVATVKIRIFRARQKLEKFR